MNQVITLLDQGEVAEAIRLLDLKIKDNSTDDHLYYIRGNAYYKLGDWQNAMQNYMEAAELNPDSPAQEALKMTQSILEFYNTDIYCQ
ncbi:MAG: tetratricopeptide repeat protein [Bacteroidaceae bacterium]|nr:tetratricopeptide repeat protein [Bacteroidaceae bacterium]